MIPANAAPLAIALLGLLLGMRHATDPDHVIAVTTILSRERRLVVAARIGVIWGLGHTMTVLIVGAAIIVFKIAIPVRLGLAMEFAVAVMLILLGVGSAAGLLRRAAIRMLGASARDESLIVHAHPHTHDGAMHAHPHVHLERSRRRRRRRDASRSSYPRRRPAVVRRAAAAAEVIRRGTGTRTGGQRGDCAAGAERDSVTAVGDDLPRDLLRRHDHRNGTDHDRDRHAVHGRFAASLMDSANSRDRIRPAEFRLRPVPRLPHRHRRSSVQHRTDLDSAMNLYGCCIKSKLPLVIPMQCFALYVP